MYQNQYSATRDMTTLWLCGAVFGLIGVHIILTHCGPVTSYGVIDLCQCFSCNSLLPVWHQAIAWTNVYLYSMMLYDIHLRTIEPSHKSHNSSDKYPTMHCFVTEMGVYVHISVTKWCIVGYGTSVLWDMWDRSNRLEILKISTSEMC